MSGVVGAWLPAAEDEQLLQQLAPMLRALQQRGRGRIGYWTDAEAGLALGHCRAPTDTPLQPLSSDCGRYVLCLDGRLYNRGDLQAQLRDLPRSCSDARLLLQAIVEWGVERALSRVEGAFGFSVWDRESRALWLARDPVGERPLYYGWFQGQFLFASEMKALQAFAGFAPSIDQDALSLLLRHDYVPAPHTIYRGIHKLVAGAMLRVDLDDHAAGGSSQATEGGTRYWCARDAMQRALQEPLQPTPSLEQATDQLEAVLQKAIAARMHSPLACGAFLSGGTDSSLVTAMMQAQSTLPIEAWTVGFDDPGHDESDWASQVARHLGVQHHLHRMDARQGLDLLQRLPQVWCEPFADASQLPTLLASELLGARKPVALTGDGGDELFFGHPSYGRALRNARLCGGLPDWVRDLARRSGNRMNVERGRLGGWRALVAEVAANDVEGHYLQRVTRWRQPAQVVLGAREPITIFQQQDTALPAEARIQLLDFRMDLAEGILAKVDRAGMAAGVETRAPLLDMEVVRLAWRLPQHLKYHDGEHKRILKHLLARYLPEPLVYRPKRGFGPPMARWLAGPLRDWAEALLDPQLLRNQGCFDAARVRGIWEAFLRGERKWHTHLWNVLMFQAWHQHWHGGRGR
ncbi:asparagine synthase (glutamine-hydrolyzing) [Stenotrophomonas maltophilia]|uniref:asparagine synthase (glutamine-hydrolyzing) n=1 Tax=Stenotrophomonas TaxID=40323 RepID=UPI000C15BF6B|nr:MULTISPECIES: asparagine synthase (glutamine-hydrolyzing) [Stenotrophomonas]MBH1840557.1 asparagine synthase (glutamine-hydrolyzing) [Stenotrophomonas maltophilia]MDV3465757.1 asparagine synthase (glutamine-hydrolyzing) [Stenotrophomonas sp. C960]MDV3530593.1 asparagine synthase (glutamine-hydrolyzing) [Stenotrophomonas sp. C2866]RTY08795.1 asparagine synthase (glutamine-hydrolyzing) [Stenotrophomonas geniculata]